MYPILGRYGSLFVYSYTVVMVAGICAAIGLIFWLSRRNYVPDWFDALLVVMVASLVGGRIGFIMSHWGYFQDNLTEVAQIWQGGLSYHGALLAGIFALLGWAAMRKNSFNSYAVLLAPAFALLGIFGWIACLLDGCAYGQETILGLISADLPDEFGVYAVRYQTQVAGILLMTTVFLLILWYQVKNTSATVFWSALAGVSLVHLLISPLRGDPTIAVGRLRLDTMLDLLLVLISLVLLQYERLKGKQIDKQP